MICYTALSNGVVHMSLVLYAAASDVHNDILRCETEILTVDYNCSGVRRVGG